MYTVPTATLMLFAVGRVRAEPPTPAESGADVSALEQPLVLQRLSLIDSELEAERQAQRQYPLVAPMVVASLGALPAAGGLFTLALGGLMGLAMPDDGPGGPKFIELPWVRNSLYVIGAGTVVAAGGLGWLFYWSADDGRPVAFYSDKATVFRVSRKLDHGGAGITQFGRAMRELSIDVICANTPTAKGRVERAHVTLQDRLVKEMRLAGVGSVEDGNLFLALPRPLQRTLRQDCARR